MAKIKQHTLPTKFLQAIELSSKFSEVKRAVGYRTNHAENDSEHSYQVALVAWALNDQYKLKLNLEKIFKLALVHDLVEVYAGDVDAHGDKKARLSKERNEKKALLKIKKNYAQLSEIISQIEEYEKKESMESKLVNITDKIIPIRHLYNQNNKEKYYIKRKVTSDDWIKWISTIVNYPTLPPKLKKIVDDAIKEAKTTYIDLFY